MFIDVFNRSLVHKNLQNRLFCDFDLSIVDCNRKPYSACEKCQKYLCGEHKNAMFICDTCKNLLTQKKLSLSHAVSLISNKLLF